MAKELKSRGENELNARKKRIDSLYLQLNDPENTDDKEQLMQRVIAEKESFEQFNHEFAASESLKIWKRINDYAKDFSEQNGYDIIFGAQPNASVLYGKEENNITNQFTEYINTRYEGN